MSSPVDLKKLVIEKWTQWDKIYIAYSFNHLPVFSCFNDPTHIWPKDEGRGGAGTGQKREMRYIPIGLLKTKHLLESLASSLAKFSHQKELADSQLQYQMSIRTFMGGFLGIWFFSQKIINKENTPKIVMRYCKECKLPFMQIGCFPDHTPLSWQVLCSFPLRTYELLQKKAMTVPIFA